MLRLRRDQTAQDIVQSRSKCIACVREMFRGRIATGFLPRALSPSLPVTAAAPSTTLQHLSWP